MCHCCARQVLSMDYYPTFPESSSVQEGISTKDAYGQTLGVLRQQAEAAPGGPIPFWNFFNTMPYDGRHSDPTEAILRWQMTTSLAYGASGVMYFCYWSPDRVFKLGGGVIVPRGFPNGTIVWERGPHWYEAQRINSVLKIYGGFLLGRKSVGVYRANSTAQGTPYTVDNSTTQTPECVIARLANNGPIAADWLVGVFDVANAPRWGPPMADRVSVPAGYTHAVVLQNQVHFL